MKFFNKPQPPNPFHGSGSCFVVDMHKEGRNMYLETRALLESAYSKLDSTYGDAEHKILLHFVENLEKILHLEEG